MPKRVQNALKSALFAQFSPFPRSMLSVSLHLYLVKQGIRVEGAMLMRDSSGIEAAGTRSKLSDILTENRPKSVESQDKDCPKDGDKTTENITQSGDSLGYEHTEIWVEIAEMCRKWVENRHFLSKSRVKTGDRPMKAPGIDAAKSHHSGCIVSHIAAESTAKDTHKTGQRRRQNRPKVGDRFAHIQSSNGPLSNTDA